MKATAVLARVVYGLLFVVVLPGMLAVWAVALDARLPGLAPLHAPAIGAVVAAIGVLLMVVGLLTLMIRGHGLPMNAFPPVRLVTQGVYAVVSDPIYLGFVLVCGGVALAVGSAAGLWLVTPIVALGAAALVLGYEQPELVRRFGTPPRPWLSLPPAGPEAPTWPDRAATVVLVFVPWLLL
jgi:protein-S-isoprenylcysteine O-methyltransferase Ste14